MSKISDRYCEKCGSLLINNLKFSHYSNDDGEKLFIIESKCPNRKWYNFHTKYIRTKIVYDTMTYHRLLVDESGDVVNLN